MNNAKQALKLIGARIREARQAKGWSQEALAHHASIDRSYAGGIERGERNITVSLLCKIAKSLDMDPANLIKNLPPE